MSPKASQALLAQSGNVHFKYLICYLYVQNTPNSGHPALEGPPWLTGQSLCLWVQIPGYLTPHQGLGVGLGMAKGQPCR